MTINLEPFVAAAVITNPSGNLNPALIYTRIIKAWRQKSPLTSTVMPLTVDEMSRANLASKLWGKAQRKDIKYKFHIFLQENYRLWFGTYSGNAGDALSGGSNFEDQWSASHRGMQFTTFDKDHDQFLAGNCASENKGGWWFNRYGKQLIPLGCVGCGWLHSWEDLPALQQLEAAVCTFHLSQPNLDVQTYRSSKENNLLLLLEQSR